MTSGISWEARKARLNVCVAALKAATSDIESVVDGVVALRNGTPEDLKKAKSVTIMVLYVDYDLPVEKRVEVFGVAAFRIEELSYVARMGPTDAMLINDRTVWQQRLSEIAAREHKRLTAEAKDVKATK